MRIIYAHKHDDGTPYAAAYGSSFPRGSVLGMIEQASIHHAMLPLPRWYGVSIGDGNNGVSHMFPDYYVFTNDPWELADRAAKSAIKPEYWDEIEIDGDEDYTVTASTYDADNMEYCDFVLDVFPVDQEEIDKARATVCYGSISEACGTEY